ncbi:MAG: IucA/IucC family protein [Tumebacillaceae bacterium]
MKRVSEAMQSPQYAEVRRRIFRQLVESLIYEKVVVPEERAMEQGILFRIAGQTESGERVWYEARGRRMLTFGRIRLERAPLMREGQEAESLAQFLLEVRHGMGADEARVAQFIHELEETLFKDTLAQHEKHVSNRWLKGASYDDLEGDVMDGHPYHPSYKSRIGFDAGDQYAYGPEFKPDVRPLWVAVSNEFAKMAVSASLEHDAFLERELGAEQVEAFAEIVKQAGQDPADYRLLPVHPWQWAKLASAYHDDLQHKRLIPLAQSADAYRPQQSIRTMANHTAPEKAYLKLSMSLINTSTGRILAPHTVQNAPVVSDWLKGLVQDDPYLRDELRVVMLGEIMGLSYDPPALSPLVQAKRYGTLGCIWRESLHPHLTAEESAVPFNALTALDLDGKPMIDAWVREQGAEAWLEQLFTVSFLPLVHLLFAHGIALETHAQNAVLIHRDGIPARLALKDLHDGIRFSKQHLRNPEQCPTLLGTPDFHARVNVNSFLETDDPEMVRDFMHDAFFFINIGELALLMAEHYQVAEEAFWSLARRVLERYQAQFPELQDRFETFDLYVPTVEVEQLTKRRLFPDTELRVHRVSNPLGGR